MTSTLRRAAGGLTAAEGIWTMYVALEPVKIAPISCGVNGCPGLQLSGLLGGAALVLAVLLLLDGAVGIWGARYAYTAGAVLSAVLLVLLFWVAWVDSGYPYLSAVVSYCEVGIALAAVALVADALGGRGGAGISEQANPMNLPVFG